MLPRLRRYARVLAVQSDAADDLVAETLTRARDTAVPEPSPAPLSVMAIMHRLHQRSRRRPGRLRRAAATAAPEASASHPNHVLDVLWQLPIDEREVLMLVAVERLTYDEVATLLEVPAATVMARLSAARSKLRGLMD